MKRYTEEVEHMLYRLYVCRQRRDRMRKMGLPERAMQHGDAAVKGYESSLERHGLLGEEVELALSSRWLDFEGNEMRFDRMDRCLTHMLQVQARVKAGVPRDHDKTFSCELAEDCLSCTCFTESTEDQRVNFDHGCEVNTGEKIPGFQIGVDGGDV